jgi:hydroxyethylthiazole kinase-like uncharacterized protein yjeF
VNWPTARWSEVTTVSSTELQQADSDVEQRFGIEPLQLMEIAGWQVARFAEEFFRPLVDKPVLVVAGSGNNGGDALCAARFLQQLGARVRVSAVPGRAGSLASRHATTLRSIGVELREAPDGIDGWCEVVIDGLLGTGIRPPLRQGAATLIAAVNSLKKPVIAIDVPSGLDADDGGGADDAIRALATVTLVAPKAGLTETAAAGRVFVADIGMPVSVFSTAAESLRNLYRRGALVEIVVDERRRAD